MWIPKTITADDKQTAPFTAAVMYSNGSRVTVSSLEKTENLGTAAPYGIACRPPRGKKAVVLPVGDSAVVCGFAGDDPLSLEEGEIGLYSSGGASIVLKNDGSVVINGKIFNAEGD